MKDGKIIAAVAIGLALWAWSRSKAKAAPKVPEPMTPTGLAGSQVKPISTPEATSQTIASYNDAVSGGAGLSYQQAASVTLDALKQPDSAAAKVAKAYIASGITDPATIGEVVGVIPQGGTPIVAAAVAQNLINNSGATTERLPGYELTNVKINGQVVARIDDASASLVTLPSGVKAIAGPVAKIYDPSAEQQTRIATTGLAGQVSTEMLAAASGTSFVEAQAANMAAWAKMGRLGSQM